jgi:hypothetical protein
MKKLILGALLLLSTVSCQKETKKCNCGLIVDDPIVGNQYGLTITNDCSGNTQTFYFSESVWFNSYVGDNFCITNVPSWIDENDSIVEFEKEIK